MICLYLSLSVTLLQEVRCEDIDKYWSNLEFRYGHRGHGTCLFISWLDGPNLRGVSRYASGHFSEAAAMTYSLGPVNASDDTQVTYSHDSSHPFFNESTQTPFSIFMENSWWTSTLTVPCCLKWNFFVSSARLCHYVHGSVVHKCSRAMTPHLQVRLRHTSTNVARSCRQVVFELTFLCRAPYNYSDGLDCRYEPNACPTCYKVDMRPLQYRCNPHYTISRQQYLQSTTRRQHDTYSRLFRLSVTVRCRQIHSEVAARQCSDYFDGTQVGFSLDVTLMKKKIYSTKIHVTRVT